MDNWFVGALWALTPTVLILIFFWLVLRSIIRADRSERRAYQKVEAEERAKAGLPPRTAPTSGGVSQQEV